MPVVVVKQVSVVEIFSVDGTVLLDKGQVLQGGLRSCRWAHGLPRDAFLWLRLPADSSAERVASVHEYLMYVLDLKEPGSEQLQVSLLSFLLRGPIVGRETSIRLKPVLWAVHGIKRKQCREPLLLAVLSLSSLWFSTSMPSS